MNNGGCAGLAASGSKCDVWAVEDVTKMEKSQIGRGLGFRLWPRSGPVLPDVCSNGFDSVVRVKLP